MNPSSSGHTRYDHAADDFARNTPWHFRYHHYYTIEDTQAFSMNLR
jgi:hypothetical protein